MEELLKVILALTTFSLLLLGAGTLIQLIEQVVRASGPESQKH